VLSGGQKQRSEYSLGIGRNLVASSRGMEADRFSLLSNLVAVARALVRRPRILLMDESTSALDSQTEGRLQKAIAVEQKERGMTVVLIAHRLSTVRDAEFVSPLLFSPFRRSIADPHSTSFSLNSKIVVMGGGKKIEEGSHDELVALKSAYWTMLQRHHGVIPGDDAPIPDDETRKSSSIADYTPPVDISHDLVSASIPHHMPPSTLSRSLTNDLARASSRPTARPGYSFGLQQAEEAQASVDKAEADSSTTRRGLFERFLKYVAEQRRFVFAGMVCSIFM